MQRPCKPWKMQPVARHGSECDLGESAAANASPRSGTDQAGDPDPYSPECLEAEFCELNFRFSAISEVGPMALRLLSGGRQEGGIGVARLNESSSSEARMIAECVLCTRLN